jgi:hypothetical protein
MSKGKATTCRLRIGSGTVIASIILVVLLALGYFGNWVGWDLVWRSFGVTPLHPVFFDTHAVTNHAACAAKGFAAYVLTSCASITPFNYPPIWLWLGRIGIDESDSAWLAVLMAASALAVLVALLKGRSIGEGLVASLCIISPSMMMGLERGNIDLLILALVGGAAMVLAGHKPLRMVCGVGLVGLAVILKLHPIFCVVLAARVSRRTLLFAVALAAVSVIYFALIFDYLALMRQNTPNTWLLSYGFKVPFLGLDQLESETKLTPTGWAAGWMPIATLSLTLVSAAAYALRAFARRRPFCIVVDDTSGTAFLFGAGIYCGTFMLGANFTYRLMFLLLCLPQLFDWQKRRGSYNERTVAIARSFVCAILFALWLNGNSIFLFVPQVAEWALFFGMTAIIVFNFLSSAPLFRQDPIIAKSSHRRSRSAVDKRSFLQHQVRKRGAEVLQ